MMDDCRDQQEVVIQVICNCGKSLACIWKSGGNCRNSYLQVKPCTCEERKAYCNGWNAGYKKGKEEGKC